MKPSLESFQDRFVNVLYGTEPEDWDSLARQPGFAVYRNTVFKGATDALLANFPTLERLVGTQWLRAAAAIHARLSPPTDARLLFYGAGFPGFLEHFEPAREMPYLGDVARLDLLWTQVHCADDEPGLEISALAQWSATDLGRCRLSPRAACRWVWFAQCPAYTLWRVNREQLQMPDELDWHGEGALLTRQAGQVHWQSVSAADCAFLEACAAQLSLEQAVDKALAVDPDVSVEQLIIRLVSAGAFAAGSEGRPSLNAG